ncbi:MAG: MFS transporter [Rhodospirillales bacterium]|nr:MFS transporter [Rhodospirillales bacterium]
MNEAAEHAFTALDEQHLSPRQLYAIILVALGEFIDGYDLIVMGAAIILLRPQFHLSPSAIGLLGGASFIGAALGMVVFGDLSDRLGRRAIFVANLIFFVVFSIASAFVTSLPQLFIARFMVGLGVGMDVPTSMAYISEISPRRRRGFLSGMVVNLTWVVGAMLSAIIALPLIHWTGPNAWRWMFGLAAVPAALVLIGRQILPESPRWLILHGRIGEARAALARFGVKVDDAMLAKIGARRGSYVELFRPPWRNRVLLVALAFVLNCIAGPLATIAAPFVFRSVGALSITASLLFSAAVWFAGMLGLITGGFLIDRIGRRRLLYLGAVPAACSALFMSFAGPTNPVPLIVGYFSFGYFLWLGPAFLFWVWSSELFPTHLRGRSQGFCNGLCRLAIAANIFLIPVGVALIGFRPSIIILSIPLFALALLVSRLSFLDSERLSLEVLTETVR